MNAQDTSRVRCESRAALLVQSGFDVKAWAPYDGEPTIDALNRVANPVTVLDLSIKLGRPDTRELTYVLATLALTHLEEGPTKKLTRDLVIWGETSTAARERERVSAARLAFSALDDLGKLSRQADDIDILARACEDVIGAALAATRATLVTIPRDLATSMLDLVQKVEAARIVAALTLTSCGEPTSWWACVKGVLEAALGDAEVPTLDPRGES